MQIHRETDTSGTTGTRPPESTFTGDVLVHGYFRRQSPSQLAGAVVEFAPAARTPWKSNPAGQTVVVIRGAGRAGSEDGAVVEVSVGDVLWFAPDERHWEGASPDSDMSYVALQEEGPAGSVRFHEPVTDEQYGLPDSGLIETAAVTQRR